MRASKLRKRTAGMIVILVLVSPAGLFSGTLGGGPPDRLGEGYLEQAIRDCGEIIVSPGKWRGADFLRFSAVLGTGFLLGLADSEIQDWVQERRTASSEDVSSFFSHFGNGANLSALMAGLYLAGEAGGLSGLRQTALLGFESYLVSGVIVVGLKAVCGRGRPSAGEGSSSFHPFSLKSSHYSLPSGHSTAAWAVASVIADRTDNAFVDAAVYSLAACAALSRVHDNKHWASDVFLGSALGYFIGKKICAFKRGGTDRRVNLSLDLSGSGRCVTLSMAF